MKEKAVSNEQSAVLFSSVAETSKIVTVGEKS